MNNNIKIFYNMLVSVCACLHPAIHLTSTWAYPRWTPGGPQVAGKGDDRG